MEAKDTVMHLDDIDNGRMPDSYASQRKALGKQAEISFKAGEKQGYDKGVIDKLGIENALTQRVKAERQAGIREVVEWIGRYELSKAIVEGLYGEYEGVIVFELTLADWQAKLKEWGIE